MARRRSSVTGKREISQNLRALDKATRGEIVDVLRRIGPKLETVMKAAAPYKTGALRDGINYTVNATSMTLRVGLLGTKRGRADLFYGRIQDRGRRAQIVVVKRLVRGGRAKWLDLIKSGKASARIKPAQHSIIYSMKVPEMVGKRFITGRYTDLRQETRAEIQGIYARAMARIGKAA